MKARSLAVGAALILLGSSIGVALLGGATETDEGASRMTVNDPRVLERATGVPGFEIELEVPPDLVRPSISSNVAIEIARQHGYGENDDAASVTPMLALFTSGRKRVIGGEPIETAATVPLHKDVLAWILSFDGVCVPVMGPPGHSSNVPDCAGTEINVVVNAWTGDYIEAYSYR